MQKRGKNIFKFAIAALFMFATTGAQAGLLTFEDLSSFTVSADMKTVSGVSDGVNYSIRRGNSNEIIELADHTLFGAASFSGRAHPDDTDGSRDGRWGRYSLSPFSSFNSGPNAPSSAMVISFDQPVHVFSLLAGDYGEDADRVQILLYNNANAQASNLKATLNLSDFLLDEVDRVSNDSLALLPSTSTSTPLPFTQRHVSFFTSINVRAIRIKIGEGSQGNGNTDNLSVFIDRMFFSTIAFGDIPKDDPGFSAYLDENDVYRDGSEIPGVVPAPLAAWAILALGPLVVGRRRLRFS